MSLKNRLRENLFFADFCEEEMDILTTFMEEEQLAEGAVIFNEHSPTKAVYFIIQGRVKIYRSGLGQSSFITILERHDIFGEIAFADQNIRSANANALDKTTVAKFEYDHFDVIQRQSPVIGMKLLRALIKEITKKFRAVNSSVDLKSPEQTINDLIVSRQKVRMTTETDEYLCMIMSADKPGVNPLIKIEADGRNILIPVAQIRTIALPDDEGKF